jgi:hypothetical protein
MFARIALSLGLCASPLCAQHAHPWEFPNFSHRITLSVENQGNSAFDGVAVLKAPDIKEHAPDFPGTLAIASDDLDPARVLETQWDDEAGEFAVEVHLAAHEKRPISIYYSMTLQDELPAAQHVHASHNYGYNHATAAIESELIGYRTYGGFFFDVQAHGRDEPGLFNAILGYASIAHPPAEGRDIVHIGDTLGLGGLFLQAGDRVYRPPLSTPDYTHRQAASGEPVYKVISSGPLRAVIEERLDDWALGEDHVSLRARYEMDAGQEVVHCRWWLTPLKVSRAYKVGAGVMDLPGDHVDDAPGMIVTDGMQDEKTGRVALGIDCASGGARRAGTLQTPSGGNQVVTFPNTLANGEAASGEYTFAAAWSGSGWADPAAHARRMLQQQTAAPAVTVIAYDRNPKPEGLEAEPK